MTGGNGRYPALQTAALWGLATILLIWMPVVSLAKNAITALFIVVAVWVVVGRVDDVRQALVSSRSWIAWFVLLALIVCVNIVLSSDCTSCTHDGVNRAGLVGLALLACISATVPRPNDWPMNLLTIGWFIGASLILIELLFDAPIYHAWREGDVGETFHLSRYNRQTSALILIAWALAAWHWLAARRILSAAVLCVSLLVAFSGESYAAQLSLVAGVVATGFTIWIPRMTVVALFGAGALMLLFAPFLFGVTLDLVAPLVGEVSPSITHRFEIWDHASVRALEKPLIGWGINNYSNLPVLPEELARYHDFRDVPSHVHNNFLQLWVELGLAGVIAGLVFLFIGAQSVLRVSPGVLPFACGLAAAGLSTASVAYGLWQHTWIAMIGMSVCCLVMVNAKARQTQDD